jgi:hypothetical protein
MNNYCRYGGDTCSRQSGTVSRVRIGPILAGFEMAKLLTQASLAAQISITITPKVGCSAIIRVT